ncbi:MAG: peptidoglycan editing factor PgeF [Gammaproteobacteria bacterium]|nr:peptidoglycan editing factor PgeF [Gammaproteobacteria bacterium]
MTDRQLQFLNNEWPAPKGVHALTTTRIGGASIGPYQSFNLGSHVGDRPNALRKNRALLRKVLQLPAPPVWLKQVHGVAVIDAAVAHVGTTADGAYTRRKGIVCAVLTADCLPIFLCNRAATEVAVLHAGWRGLAAGVVEAGIKKMQSPPAELFAWLGPAIGPNAFEVGDDVRTAFIQHDAAAARAFVPGVPGRWLADLYMLAGRRLRAAGVNSVQGGQYCTVTQTDLFFSFRRDGATGRMASLIWLE